MGIQPAKDLLQFMKIIEGKRVLTEVGCSIFGFRSAFTKVEMLKMASIG